MNDSVSVSLHTAVESIKAKGSTDLLPALHLVQKMYGYISEESAFEVAQSLGIPLADVQGVIGFYALFYAKPVGKTVIQVCNDPVCALAGADSVFKRMRSKVEVDEGGKQSITLERSPCLGLCQHAPALHLQGMDTVRVDSQTWQDLVHGRLVHPRARIISEVSILTRNCHHNRPLSLEEYCQGGGYTGLQKAFQMKPEDVVNEVKASGLVGRGGAAFPTGIKWEGAARASNNPKYVVCNGDEAEPGAFKDRIMMEHDPQRVLEGLIISAYAIGASQGYIYIRGEYTYPFQIMSQAVDQARVAGYLGKNILNSGFNFDVELRLGAGAYVCGEETAQFESIEGKRGLPRVKPPFPTTHGLFGKPTVINNVETLCNIPYILEEGATAYRQLGTEKSPGSKLFCLSGDVVHPGLYEVALGITFRNLLFMAGGVREGRNMQAALFGGAAGAFATVKDLDVQLSFEHLKIAGLPLGAGVIVIFDETRDLRDTLLRLSRFFAEESCGKCYPCQIGTHRQYEILQRIAANQSLAGDVERLQDIAATMTDASICGLGQTAASATISAIKLWPHLFEPIIK